MKVAFQGDSGAFSEEAVTALFDGAEPVPAYSFESVFEAIDTGLVDHGVIPIENSLFGSVHQNYDLLEEHELQIVSEVQLRIRHCLLGVPGTRIEDIRSVCSHPQALGQCRAFLKKTIPHAEAVSFYDTAGAARDVAAVGDPARAAIASARAGAPYALVTLAENIESNHQNYTRFLALARPADAAASRERMTTGLATKTSVVYAQRENLPGSLFKSLAVFALRDIDLFKIESRPLIGSPGQYRFYLDLAGSESDEPVQNALRHLQEVAATVKVLGTYPVGRILE
jgi:prephenate dehydratase